VRRGQIKAERSVVNHAGAASVNPNPFVFVVGCPRSGTTLLQRILDHHPLLAVANDTHFIPRCLEKSAPTRIADAIAGREVPLTTELIGGVRGYHRLHRLGLGEEQFVRAAEQASSYQDYVTAVYSSFARSKGKRLGGEKTPDYVRRIPLLAGLFPGARFVHIFRDGRDVALSTLNWARESKGPGKLDLWREEPVATCALWWDWQVQSGREAGALLGPARYLEVRYEALVSDPAEETRRVTDFLELPYESRMLGYHEGKLKLDPSLSAKSRWLPPTPGLRNWREQMPERDVALFEVLAGVLLEELGYELAGRPGSPEISRVAASCSQHWDAFLARRRAKELRRMRGRR
jgi:hypothetical protein